MIMMMMTMVMMMIYSFCADTNIGFEWCATETDAAGNYVEGKYARCKTDVREQCEEAQEAEEVIILYPVYHMMMTMMMMMMMSRRPSRQTRRAVPALQAVSGALTGSDRATASSPR